MKQDLNPNPISTLTDPAEKIVPLTVRKKRPDCYGFFDGPFDTAQGEAALWKAVITQALMDGLSHSKNPEHRYHKQTAIQWLTGGSKDFHLVCLLANMEPDEVRRKAKKALFSPVAWRAAPGKGARYEERKHYRRRTKPLPRPLPDAMKDKADHSVIITDHWN